ncbi:MULTISPECIES: type VI secretion system baseplate subunit TssK [unclassified Francisella]|uniref:type VI secretion system baseplate subunit TssK n=1 Tax=unclassified Francisella TaxID=2610885 RepID=UPI002E35CC5B|nr:MULTISPECIES: type VI secretion system baseplate subunit TssK [unclassified Francisella]MED7818342.1 type VI secretion system baseplate subunit TssK [Francisella sp. 19S2-4]MED7829178.1 type VI secretion system baseplate subunit TssK [Francisella sp. 19S2-10]
MSFLNKVSWEQGLFLQPQHFQMSDMSSEAALSSYINLVDKDFWGVDSFNVDENALKDERVRVNSGTVFLKSGILLEVGDNAVVVPRSFSGKWSDRSEDLNIYIGVKNISNSANVTTVESLDNLKNVQTRFVNLNEPGLIKDLYSSGPDAHVKRLFYVIQIWFGDEIELASDYELIHIAKVRQTGKKIILDEQYIPPSLHISSYDRLFLLTKSIRNDLKARANQLKAHRLQAESDDDSASQNRKWSNLLALQAFDKYAILISHLLNTDCVTPKKLFEVFLQLVGDLKAFCLDNIIADIDLDDVDFIKYDHTNLAENFDSLREIIFKLSDVITFTPSQYYQLKYMNGFYSTNLPTNAFAPRTNYYLRLSTRGSFNKGEILDIASQVKVGSLTNINHIVEHSLKGVSFEVLSEPPYGVPSDSSCIYLYLDSASDNWRDIMVSQSIAAFGEEKADEIQIDFVSVRF